MNVRLIDARKLKKAAKFVRIDGVLRAVVLYSDIMSEPTVDTVEVVRGRWEKASEFMPIYRCSICKERNLFKNGDNVFSPYCPYCGAKMKNS